TERRRQAPSGRRLFPSPVGQDRTAWSLANHFGRFAKGSNKAVRQSGDTRFGVVTWITAQRHAFTLP
ncbi:MAG: hypothetical protein WB522_16470, partial [Pseudolabrys sp.]